MLYLAQPYVHPYLPIREKRYKEGLHALYLLQKQGEFVYSPIVHWHNVDVKYNREVPRGYLMEHSKWMVKLCAVLLVLDISGWKESDGVYQEWQWARGYSKVTLLLDWEELKDGHIRVRPLGDYRQGGNGALQAGARRSGRLKEFL